MSKLNRVTYIGKWYIETVFVSATILLILSVISLGLNFNTLRLVFSIIVNIVVLATIIIKHENVGNVVRFWAALVALGGISRIALTVLFVGKDISVYLSPIVLVDIAFCILLFVGGIALYIWSDDYIRLN